MLLLWLLHKGQQVDLRKEWEDAWAKRFLLRLFPNQIDSPLHGTAAEAQLLQQPQAALQRFAF